MPIRKYDNANIYSSLQAEHLWTVLNATDVLVTQASSVGIDAYLLNKAVVQLQQSIFSKDVNYSELGIAFIANDITDESIVKEKLEVFGLKHSEEHK